MAIRKGPVMYRVRNKITKNERNMPASVYQHVKRNWDILGEVVEGDVVPLNPSQPHQKNQPKGSSAVAIGSVQVPDEVLESSDEPEAEAEDFNGGGEMQAGEAQLDQPTEEIVPTPAKGKPGRKPSVK